jgi:hypothetical protein
MVLAVMWLLLLLDVSVQQVVTVARASSSPYATKLDFDGSSSDDTSPASSTCVLRTPQEQGTYLQFPLKSASS